VAANRELVDWRGYIPAITTPFEESGAIDFHGLGHLLEWLDGEGMHGLIIAGTTGEWCSMTHRERMELFSAVGAQLRGRLPLIAGCSAYTAANVLDFASHAAACGFEGILVTPPPYMRPSEEEIFVFYRTIAAHSPIPVCAYNWPPGTSIDMSLALLQRIADLPNVAAIKQSTGDLRHFVQTFFALGDQVRIFGHSMDEHGLTLLNAAGGDGTMGAGAVLGRVHADFYNHLWNGELELARRCGAMDRVLMAEWYTDELVGKFGSGPAILKAGLNARGLPGGYVRPPLLDLTEEGQAEVKATLDRLGLLCRT
jgi:4-hydroxy-tetrahydrodipicolinate synthase